MTAPENPTFTIVAPEETFPRLTDEQIERVARHGRVRHVEHGEVLIAAGKPTTLFFVIMSATIDVVRINDIGETTVRVIVPGEFTGEVSLLSGRPMVVTL